jgi:hypothetical protein
MTHDPHAHDRGLEHDLLNFASRATGRRDMLRGVLGAAATSFVGGVSGVIEGILSRSS